MIDLDEAGEPIETGPLLARTEGDPVAEDLVPLLMISEPPPPEDGVGDVAIVRANNCLRTLRQMAFDRRIAELAHEITAAERAEDWEDRDRLTLEHLDLTRRKNALSSLRF